MIFLIILRLVITKCHQNESTQAYEAKTLAEQFSEIMLLESDKKLHDAKRSSTME